LPCPRHYTQVRDYENDFDDEDAPEAGFAANDDSDTDDENFDVGNVGSECVKP
jgi:hypothetical protein